MAFIVAHELCAGEVETVAVRFVFAITATLRRP
jgi:hypothetical protein